jgi:hypothetical protein
MGFDQDRFITVRWTCTSTDDKYFVQEHVTDTKGHVEYGPMPHDVVEAFIAERRRFFASVYQTFINQQVTKPCTR